MNFSSFLKLIEIQTKVASIIPFYLGHYMSTTVIMFFYQECRHYVYLNDYFDMTTTMINNYMDYKQAIKKKGMVMKSIIPSLVIN